MTFLFSDIVGSTDLLTRLGDREWDEVRRKHFSVLREALAGHEGAEVKNTGDGLMAVFGSAISAVDCALAMQQQALTSRGRRHAGWPADRDRDGRGDTRSRGLVRNPGGGSGASVRARWDERVVGNPTRAGARRVAGRRPLCQRRAAVVEGLRSTSRGLQDRITRSVSPIDVRPGRVGTSSSVSSSSAFWTTGRVSPRCRRCRRGYSPNSRRFPAT